MKYEIQYRDQEKPDQPRLHSAGVGGAFSQGFLESRMREAHPTGDKGSYVPKVSWTKAVHDGNVVILKDATIPICVGCSLR